MFDKKFFKSKNILAKKSSQKIYGLNCFRGNDFATIQNLRPKTFSTKNVFQPNCFLGNDFATKKIFVKKNSLKFFSSKLFSSK